MVTCRLFVLCGVPFISSSKFVSSMSDVCQPQCCHRALLLPPGMGKLNWLPIPSVTSLHVALSQQTELLIFTCYQTLCIKCYHKYWIVFDQDEQEEAKHLKCAYHRSLHVWQHLYLGKKWEWDIYSSKVWVYGILILPTKSLYWIIIKLLS